MNQTIQHNDCYTQQYVENNKRWMQNVEYNTFSSICEADENQSDIHIKAYNKIPHVADVILKQMCGKYFRD